MTIGITGMPDGFKKYVKKPVQVGAMQINEKFEVVTMEGIMTGKAGDYLIQGIMGELYPCDKEIFEKSYDLLTDRLDGISTIHFTSEEGNEGAVFILDE